MNRQIKITILKLHTHICGGRDGPYAKHFQCEFNVSWISPSNLGGQLTDIVFEYLCHIRPVNGILLGCSAWCVGHEGYCCDLDGFDVYSSFWIEQVKYCRKICYKALLRWVPRWKDDSLFGWIVWRCDFCLDCLLYVLEVCDNERGVLRRVWLEICQETYLKG